MFDHCGLKNQLFGYLELLRPFTLLAPLIVSLGIIIASYFYNSITLDFFQVFWTTILPASLSMALLNGASNALNQATDFKADSISKPYRPIPKGIISIKNAKYLSVILYTLSIVLALSINTIFSIFVFCIVFFSLTYSLKPRMKDFLFINQLWIAIPRGLIGILASWSVFGNPLQELPLTIGMIALLFLIGGSITKDIKDSDADKKTGTRTLVNMFGLRTAAFIALPFMFFPFATIPLMINGGFLSEHFWSLTFLAIPAYVIFYLMIRNDSESKILENTSAWSLMYITYFLFASCFSILTILGTFIV